MLSRSAAGRSPQLVSKNEKHGNHPGTKKARIDMIPQVYLRIFRKVLNFMLATSFPFAYGILRRAQDLRFAKTTGMSD